MTLPIDINSGCVWVTVSVNVWMNKDELKQELGDEEYFARLEAKQNEWEGMDR